MDWTYPVPTRPSGWPSLRRPSCSVVDVLVLDLEWEEGDEGRDR